MIKNFIHAVVYTLIGFISIGFSTFAIVVEVPPSQGQEDIVVTGPTQIQADESTFFDIIQLINRYLRFSIGALCMGVLVFGGIKLITSGGDQAKMKEANKLLMGVFIGIFVAIFSYVIIRILVNIL